MDRKQLLAAGGVAAIGAALPATARAGDDQDVVGSWLTTITATNPPLGSFDSLMSFHEGGVFTESRRYYVTGTPFGDLLETSGHGAWSQKGKRFSVFFRFLLQRAPTSDGGPVGTDNIRLSLTLGHKTDTLSGTFESQIKDLSGTVLLTVTGTVSGERIEV